MTDSRPPRRKRYSGTHPKKFSDRYKELDAQRFPDQAAKVRAQGRTPAGTHVPVMLAEVIAALKPKPGESFLDCTLGHGGHSEAIAKLIGEGPIIALDFDAEEQARTTARLAKLGVNVRAHHGNFAGIAKVLAAEKLSGVDMVLADLGVSSMQIDNPERGFSFKHDGPLDMRMDRTRGKTAQKLLRELTEKELAEILREFGDEPQADAVAAEVKTAEPTTSGELCRAVLRAKGLPAKYRQKTAGDTHPAARVFQALRIAVNREFENLDALLRTLPYVLNKGGRAAIITFHSGEEKRVRAALELGLASGQFAAADVAGQPPGREEIYANPRARSAKLFWARC